jgi:predicted membrane protein
MVFLIISIYPVFNSGDLRIWSSIVSLVFLILGIMNSKILTPLNKIWFKFGILLGIIVSPIVMGIVYFAVVFPTSLIMRSLGKDLLRLKKNREKTYWVESTSSKSSMKNQF